MFIANETSFWIWTFGLVDCLFLVDMIVTFFTTITDNDKLIEETNKKVIACVYLKGWFWIDLVSIFPFDDFTNAISEMNTPEDCERDTNSGPSGNIMARGFKLGKLGKMIRLMRLLKVFKMMKNTSHLKSHFGKKLEIDAGMERLVMIFLQFFFANHIFALFWVFLGESSIST